MRAIGYTRVSTDKQADRGVSLDAQTEKIRAMALVHDAELIDIIVEAGESAKALTAYLQTRNYFDARVTWNYSTYLNIVFLTLAAVLLWRYFRRGGGWSMLRMMNEPMGEHGHA